MGQPWPGPKSGYTQEEWEAIFGGEEEDKLPALVPGQRLISADTWEEYVVSPSGTLTPLAGREAWGAALGPAAATGVGPEMIESPVPSGGVFYTDTGHKVLLNARGQIINSTKMSDSERKALGLWPSMGAGGPQYVSAPDPYGAAQLQMRIREAQQEVNERMKLGGLTEDQAVDVFNAQLDSIFAENERVGQIQRSAEQRVSRALGIEDIATQRGNIYAGEILPRSLPGVPSLNLPFFGNLPGTPVRPGTFFQQFAEPMGGGRPVPNIPQPAYGRQIPQLMMPPIDVAPMPGNLQAMADQLLRGIIG